MFLGGRGWRSGCIVGMIGIRWRCGLGGGWCIGLGGILGRMKFEAGEGLEHGDVEVMI